MLIKQVPIKVGQSYDQNKEEEEKKKKKKKKKRFKCVIRGGNCLKLTNNKSIHSIQKKSFFSFLTL